MAEGVSLRSGCRVTHGAGAGVKQPFATIPLVMHELSAGGSGFCGQFGFIPFRDDFRLPRHVHLGDDETLVAERILVLNGVGLAELNGEILVVAPGSLVDIAPGVPHTWTACPPGVRLPNGMVSDGSFLMIYEYAAPTGFFPIVETGTLSAAADYQPFTGDLEAIRFPVMTASDVVARATLVWGLDERTLG